ncbi:FixH family protein [Nitratireductor sp. ZSWI3]|uniref:FixH family protein n=1 Tax=Nitratireductor sp. ZSWI3 TaxID=2966359 RepID=UPI002150522C|nr:FixH family protein [Nitratireductor sp. ZSWI3]MCR4266225.1 FixH family protein [Nitratireductor sp. ZSWI3]
MSSQAETGKNRFILALFGLVIAAVAVYAGYRLLAPPPPQIDVTYNTVSADGLYQVTFETDLQPVPVGETHAWILTVTTPDGAPVSDAEIAVDGGMPAHGHGLPTEPKVTENLGEGRYRVEGMRFNMGGHWEIRVGISATPGLDEAKFNIDL